MYAQSSYLISTIQNTNKVQMFPNWIIETRKRLNNLDQIHLNEFEQLLINPTRLREYKIDDQQMEVTGVLNILIKLAINQHDKYVNDSLEADIEEPPSKKKIKGKEHSPIYFVYKGFEHMNHGLANFSTVNLYIYINNKWTYFEETARYFIDILTNRSLTDIKKIDPISTLQIKVEIDKFQSFATHRSNNLKDDIKRKLIALNEFLNEKKSQEAIENLENLYEEKPTKNPSDEKIKNSSESRSEESYQPMNPALNAKSEDSNATNVKDKEKVEEVIEDGSEEILQEIEIFKQNMSNLFSSDNKMNLLKKCVAGIDELFKKINKIDLSNNSSIRNSLQEVLNDHQSKIESLRFTKNEFKDCFQDLRKFNKLINEKRLFLKESFSPANTAQSNFTTSDYTSALSQPFSAEDRGLKTNVDSNPNNKNPEELLSFIYAHSRQTTDKMEEDNNEKENAEIIANVFKIIVCIQEQKGLKNTAKNPSFFSPNPKISGEKDQADEITQKLKELSLDEFDEFKRFLENKFPDKLTMTTQ